MAAEPAGDGRDFDLAGGNGCAGCVEAGGDVVDVAARGGPVHAFLGSHGYSGVQWRGSWRLAAGRKIRYVNIECAKGRFESQRTMLEWLEHNLP